MDLVWVDLDLGVPPSCPAVSTKFPSAPAELGRQWNTQSPSQPNHGPVYEQIGHAVVIRRGIGNSPKFFNEVAQKISLNMFLTGH